VLATAALEPTTSGGTAINTTSVNDVTIGNWATDSARPFRGILDDVRLYPRTLSATEIASLAAQSPDQATAASWFFRFSGSDLPAASDWTSDSDKDGFPALLEYALGGNPTDASWSIAPSISPDGSQFIFNRRKSGLAAAAYQAEHSATLEGGSWLPVTPGGTLPHPDLTGFERVVVPLPESPEKRGFFRLRVVGP
jgi:hypothetical protein